jgi:hypothetical protein
VEAGLLRQEISLCDVERFEIDKQRLFAWKRGRRLLASGRLCVPDWSFDHVILKSRLIGFGREVRQLGDADSDLVFLEEQDDVP